MADIKLFFQGQPYTLSGSGASIGDTTVILSKSTDILGNTLSMATYFGTKGYATLEPNSQENEEAITFSGITVNANGTMTLTGVKTQLFKDPYTETSGLRLSHAGGTKLVFSNTAGFYSGISGKDNDETITGKWTFATVPETLQDPSTGDDMTRASYTVSKSTTETITGQKTFPSIEGTRARIDADTDTAINTALVTFGQLSRQAIAGAANASETVKGLVEEATQAEVDAGTAVGGTGARLYINPSKLANASETIKGVVEEATQAEMNAGTNTGGTGAKLFVPPSKIKSYLAAPTAPINSIESFTADEDITIGQAVGVSNLLPADSIARAMRTASNVAHGITTPVGPARNANVCPIGGDKFVYLQSTAATSDTLFAQVGSINPSTKVVTLGTAVAVATAFTPQNSSNHTVCKLDTDKFIVFYMADASATAIQYRIGTVSGTTITFGTAATFFTAASTVAASQAFCADFISTDKGIFVFKAATATNGKMIAFTTSGTTVATTSATPVTPGTNSDDDVASYVKKIGTDKYVLVTPNTANSIYAQVCTLAGTVITAGTEVQISTATSVVGDGNLQVVSPVTDVFVVRIRGTDDQTAALVACTVAGTVPTPGTTIQIVGSGGFGSVGGLHSVSSTSLIVTGGSAPASTQLSQIALSGNTLTNNGITMMGVFSTTGISQIPQYTSSIDNGYFIFFNNPGSGVTSIDFYIQGMSNDFIGIAQSSVSRGASVNVLYSGKDSNQTNLSLGGYYRASSGSLVFISSRSLTGGGSDDISTLPVARAISSTEVII